MHGLHVLAGIVALALVIGRINRQPRRFSKEYVRSDRHVFGISWEFCALPAFGFAHGNCRRFETGGTVSETEMAVHGHGGAPDGRITLFDTYT